MARRGKIKREERERPSAREFGKQSHRRSALSAMLLKEASDVIVRL